MISAVVAIEPTKDKPEGFERFCALLRFFQEKGLITETAVASLIHPNLYLVPLSWYREHKETFAAGARRDVEAVCRDKFRYSRIDVLESESSSHERLVDVISDHVKGSGGNLLVVSSSERRGLPYWLLGSFSGTATLTASVPVMVLKPHAEEADFAPDARFVVCLDPSAPIATEAVDWLAAAATSSGALLDLIYVVPKPHVTSDPLHLRNLTLEAEEAISRLKGALDAKGARSEISVLEERDSVGDTIVTFAEQRKAWALVTLAAERSLARKLLMGSTVRHVLTTTRRPLIHLRFGD